MTQEERRIFLIEYLEKEENRLKKIHVPAETAAQKRLLRSLMNIRPAKPVSKEFLIVQDAYLQEEQAQKGIVSLTDVSPIQPGIYLWKGDITRLSVDAIVNAANSELLGCFIPCHRCIDNTIHTFAGVRLREECAHIMKRQNMPEPAGRAKITRAYNLPCRYVLHTVGPIIYETVTQKDCDLLAACYRSCLELATAHHLESVAFCCISTGEFRFPNERAAGIAIQAVQDYLEKNDNGPEVVFNVFKNSDYEIYERLLR